MIDIMLPMPPSANAIWRGTGARVVKSVEYKRWLVHAGMVIQMAKAAGEIRPFAGKYMLLLALPPTMRGDIDNRHKAVNDLLQSVGLIENDSLCECLLVMRADEVRKEWCRVVAGKRSHIIHLHPLIKEVGAA